MKIFEQVFCNLTDVDSAMNFFIANSNLTKLKKDLEKKFACTLTQTLKKNYTRFDVPSKKNIYNEYYDVNGRPLQDTTSPISVSVERIGRLELETASAVDTIRWIYDIFMEEYDTEKYNFSVSHVCLLRHETFETLVGTSEGLDYDKAFSARNRESGKNYFSLPAFETKQELASAMKKCIAKISEEEKLAKAKEFYYKGATISGKIYEPLSKEFEGYLKSLEKAVKEYYDGLTADYKELKNKAEKETFPLQVDGSYFTKSGRKIEKTKSLSSIDDYVSHFWKGTTSELVTVSSPNPWKFIEKEILELREDNVNRYLVAIADVLDKYDVIFSVESKMGKNGSPEAIFKTPLGNVHLVTFGAGTNFKMNSFQQTYHLRTKITLLKG